MKGEKRIIKKKVLIRKSRTPTKRKPIQKKKKRINSAFLTLDEYKMLKDLTPRNVEDVNKADWMGRRSFTNKTNMKIDQESPYIFHDIKNGKEPIFILNKPLNVSVNDLKIVGEERLYKTGRGIKYYYKYKGKNYIQKTRYIRRYDIYSRDNAPIYPYKTLKELKPRLKAHGLKRISKPFSDFGYISKPFRLTYNEKRLKQLQRKVKVKKKK